MKIRTYQFENNKEEVVDDKGPFSSISITGNTKDGRAHRSEHENKSDTPCNILLRLIERLAQTSDGQRNAEEVEGIPSLHPLALCPNRLQERKATYPSRKGNEEKGPLLSVKHANEFDRVGDIEHRRLERGEAGGDVLASGHTLVRGTRAVFGLGHHCELSVEESASY